jgi:hypothetical protein
MIIQDSSESACYRPSSPNPSPKRGAPSVILSNQGTSDTRGLTKYLFDIGPSGDQAPDAGTRGYAESECVDTHNTQCICIYQL